MAKLKNGQLTLADVSDEYAAFVEKFKPKKTTDDCYTPDNIYEAVKDWACREYDRDPEKVIRPFWPGADYRSLDYPEGCTVIDNPPFSILTKIIRDYMDNGVAFFMFAPALTLFAGSGVCNYIPTGASVTYANGAVVNTSFVTSLGEDFIRCAPDLNATIRILDDENKKATTRTVPSYVYPANVLSAAMCNYFSVHGVDFRLRRENCYFIRALNSQRQRGKAIFGGGFLISDGGGGA